MRAYVTLDGSVQVQVEEKTAMSRHTPGPWHFVRENAGLMSDHGYGILYGEPDSWGWEKNLYVSVGCSGNVEQALGAGAAEANARLIAAAPEMLAMLKRLRAATSQYIGLVFNEADALIAKAEGVDETEEPGLA